MEKLSAKQQTDVQKMSTERLRTNLIAAGYDEVTVAGYGRPELLNLYAEYLSMPTSVVVGAGKLATGGVGPEEGTAQEDGATAGGRSDDITLRERELALRERELRVREQELARLQKKDVEEKSR